MSDILPSGVVTDVEPEPTAPEFQNQTLRLHAEQLAVCRRRIPTSVVRVSRITQETHRLVDEELIHELVEVQRVPVGRMVDAVPPTRVEGDVTILSVVEEVVVVERRLVLKEEVHIRRVRTAERHVETVVLREQAASVTRTDTHSFGHQPTPVTSDQPSNRREPS